MSRRKRAVAERAAIEFPRCPHCGGTMILTRIEPEQPGRDRRTFECRDCGRSETKVVVFRELTESEIDPPGGARAGMTAGRLHH